MSHCIGIVKLSPVRLFVICFVFLLHFLRLSIEFWIGASMYCVVGLTTSSITLVLHTRD